MGEPSKDISMEKMYELFSKLFEQQQLKVVPEVTKYALEPTAAETMLAGHVMLS
jgi:hypothetical protein